MRGFLAAFQFLTVLPIPGRMAFSDQDMGRSMAYYPLVGLCLGVVLVLARHVLGAVLPHTVVAILLVIVLAVMTGGLHLDGFSDTIDGLRSGTGRDDVLRIMRDSRVGAFGAIGLTCLLILKFTLLLETPEAILDRSLLLMAAVSRWTMVQTSYRSAYARPEGGLAKPFLESIGMTEVLVAAALTLVMAGGLFGVRGWLIVGCNGLLAYGIRYGFHRRLGGITGDILGATNETSEVLSMMLVLVMVG